MTDLSDMPWATPMDEGETYTPPAHGWTCFHCGETFMGQQAARLHFGASIHDEPKCQISAHRLRAMEGELNRYRDEDTDLHREIARLKSDHATELRREEDKGYARGLEDAKKYPETLGLARGVDPTPDAPPATHDSGSCSVHQEKVEGCRACEQAKAFREGYDVGASAALTD